MFYWKCVRQRLFQKFEEELKQIENEEFDIKLLEQFIQRRNEAAYKSNENNTVISELFSFFT